MSAIDSTRIATIGELPVLAAECNAVSPFYGHQKCFERGHKQGSPQYELQTLSTRVTSALARKSELAIETSPGYMYEILHTIAMLPFKEAT